MASRTSTRILLALFAVYIAATAIHIGYVMAHEPFTFDAWNVAVDTRSEPFSIGRFFDYWSYEYAHSNPRLGQAFTYLAYKLDGFAEVATPLAYLALTLAITVLGIGRWPWRRGPGAFKDLGLWAIAIGFGWFVVPEIGRNMFCRAYSANYVYGAAIQLWFLVPLRLAHGYDATPRAMIAYALAGVVAGICNEHTGPVFVAMFALLVWSLHRRREPMRFVAAGGLGFALGFAAIFFAPGQSERYDGLAQQVSLPMRLAQRHVLGNLDIVREYVRFASPLLLLLAVLLVVAQLRPTDTTSDEGEIGRKPALRGVALALILGLALTVTLFVSPKLGSRFYLVPCALLLASVIGVIDAIAGRRMRIALIVFAVAASTYAAIRTIPTYVQAKRESDARMAALAATPKGGTFVADSFVQVDESWWFIGDDFRNEPKRQLVAEYMGLARVYFRGWDPDVPLGSTGIRLVPRVWIDGQLSGETVDFDTAGIKQFDIAGLQSSARTSVELLQRTRPAGAKRLDRFEVDVEFIGSHPLPRPRLVLARWQPGRFESYQAAIVRGGVGSTRDIRLATELRARPFEIYVLQIGSEFRRLGTTSDPSLSYTPWRGGVYWILACDANECWVVAASKNQTV